MLGAAVAALFAVGVVGSGGCAKQRSQEPALSNVDAETAARLGLTADAIDPTERDEQAGYNRWKPKPEPEGTAAPLSPTRRKIGAPPP